MSSAAPIASLKVTRHHVPAFGPFPNCRPTNRPLTILHRVFPSAPVSQIQAHLRQQGVVHPQWVYSMYREHHFHSTTHEVLVVSRGSARLCFGGKDNPDRVEYQANRGDVMVVPAGLAHALLEDTSEGGQGYEMVGSYPVGASQWDHCTATSGQDQSEVERKIKDLRWFDKDPVYGDLALLNA